jgi:hypothetical protein
VHVTRRQAASALLVPVLAVLGLAGCARGGPSAAPEVPQAQMEHLGQNKALSVVLTPLGARRIAIQTAPAVASGRRVLIPVRALLYEPDGRTVVYTKTAAYAYTRQFITVTVITSSQVVVTSGLSAGAQVVTEGAEELLGVQNGVGVEE